jgi:hypothetical protein
MAATQVTRIQLAAGRYSRLFLLGKGLALVPRWQASGRVAGRGASQGFEAAAEFGWAPVLQSPRTALTSDTPCPGANLGAKRSATCQSCPGASISNCLFASHRPGSESDECLALPAGRTFLVCVRHAVRRHEGKVGQLVETRHIHG